MSPHASGQRPNHRPRNLDPNQPPERESAQRTFTHHGNPTPHASAPVHHDACDPHEPRRGHRHALRHTDRHPQPQRDSGHRHRNARPEPGADRRRNARPEPDPRRKRDPRREPDPHRALRNLTHAYLAALNTPDSTHRDQARTIPTTARRALLTPES